MLQLIKRDWLHTRAILLALAILVPVFALLQLSFIYIFVYSFITICLYTNHEQHINRFLVSLPVKKHLIVLSRYLFIFIVCLGLLLYTVILAQIQAMTPYPPIIYLMIFTVMSLAIAVSLPLYYFFKNSWWAFITQLVCFVLGAFLFAFVMSDPFDKFEGVVGTLLSVIFIEPYSILIVCSIAVVSLSYWISWQIFSHQDLA